LCRISTFGHGALKTAFQRLLLKQSYFEKADVCFEKKIEAGIFPAF